MVYGLCKWLAKPPEWQIPFDLACTICEIHSCLDLVWLLAWDLELVEKSKWNTIFRLDIPAGNFGLSLKT